MKWDHGQRRQSIVQSLLTEVFEGSLRAGQHLVTQDLSARFGVSHTPIREALIAVAGMGIVDLLPNRGAIVRRVTARDVHEICQVRRVLECEATRNACGRADADELDTLIARLRALIAGPPAAPAALIEEARVLDSRLHDLVASASGNQFLANEIGRLKILFRVCRDVTYQHDPTRVASGRFADEAREHLAIVTSLREGDRRAAVHAMSRHISTSIDHWGRLLPDTDEIGSPKKRSRTRTPSGPTARNGHA
jgi:DNA-binding GntR family transcriptional regulator